MRYEFFDGFPPGASRQHPGSRLALEDLAAPNPGALRMYRYRPENCPANAPLLVILHGCGQTAMALDHGAGWSTLAQRFGFALLAPEQTSANNMGTCFNWFLAEDTSRGHGEAASIHQMITQTIRDFGSDPARIFITGLSAGGAMSSAMLAAYPETFAAGAIIAGLPHGAAFNVQEAMSAMYKTPPRAPEIWGDAVRQASSHKGPWPRVSVWHGDADRTVAPTNMEAIVAQWRDVHGLALEARRSDALVAGAQHRAWQDPRGVTKVEAYILPGMGHGVPIRPDTQKGTQMDCCGEAGPFILDAGISSSFHIAQFFGLTKTAPAKTAAAARPPRPANPRLAELPLPLFQAAVKIPALPRSAAPIKTVIVKALKAAGLIKDA